MLTATYCPADNKLRLYPSSRLDEETYKRVKAAGFSWAPRQELFVAPMWTPEREDLAIELAGEIEDESMTMAERAEMRAKRFKGFSASRTRDAEQSANAAKEISGRFEFGQPILVGHHSERKARKDAKKIESSLKYSAKMWDTAAYWIYRAQGAMSHASYKANPVATARRIKRIESDRRKTVKELETTRKLLKFWQSNPTREDALSVLGCIGQGFYIKDDSVTGSTHAYYLLKDEKKTVEQIAEHGVKCYTRNIPNMERWIAHYDNRLAYEREFIKTTSEDRPVATGEEIQVGGTVWRTIRGVSVPKVIVKVNKGAEKRPVSVRVDSPWDFYGSTIAVEKIERYQAPSAEQAQAAKEAGKATPIVNYPGDGFVHMTKAEWARKPNDYKSLKIVNSEGFARYRIRHCVVPNSGYSTAFVYITDAKTVERPAKKDTPKLAPAGPEEIVPTERKSDAVDEASELRKKAAEAKEAAKAGVQVVSANQLFPTPVELAWRMVSEADIEKGMSILEPSAGTGRILDAIFSEWGESVEVAAVEINHSLASALRNRVGVEAICTDFMEFKRIGAFDRIIMNPPFENGADIKHIMHAWDQLAVGGRLVAICANGPRQQRELRDGLVSEYGGTWEELPTGTFLESGTGVNTALIVVDK